MTEARARGVEMLYERGCKTFVAPAVGGPLHGNLRIAPVEARQFMIPRDLEFDVYELRQAADGTKAWVHVA